MLDFRPLCVLDRWCLYLCNRLHLDIDIDMDIGVLETNDYAKDMSIQILRLVVFYEVVAQPKIQPKRIFRRMHMRFARAGI